MPKIAVAIIHGIGAQKPNFAEPMRKELTKRFAALIEGLTARPAAELVIEPVYWAEVLQAEEDKLWACLAAGSRMNFKALRRFMVNFAADAIAYQPAPRERNAYEKIHQELARTLNRLAVTAGADAPLVVIAHSLGTVIASNFLYDLQKQTENRRRRFLPAAVRQTMEATPLTWGETFTAFYTFGSPIALWSLRYREFGQPIRVPSPALAAHHPRLPAVAEWINFYDPDDIIGYPLKQLNEAYRAVVTEDRRVNVGGALSSWNPLSHNAYWTDNDVTKPIAAGLARLWLRANGL